jgi:zinc/manganese transport system permease protein
MNLPIISLMLWPAIACLILPWLLVYLGLHIVRRGVIFVDLALAQMAAFGTCVSLVFKYDAHDWQSYVFSLGFTFVGAILLTLTRSKNQKVPQEALIGIVYVVAAAAAILTLNSSPHGKEELQQSLVGELLDVTPGEVIKTFGIFAAVGLVHYIFRKKFLVISEDPVAAAASGLNMRRWDLLFYILFGVVVTSFVHLGGVLLVFTYLVVPAVCASYIGGSARVRFLIAWGIATLASVAGVFVAVKADLPIGAAIVCMLGLVLLGFLIIHKLLRVVMA